MTKGSNLTSCLWFHYSSLSWAEFSRLPRIRIPLTTGRFCEMDGTTLKVHDRSISWVCLYVCSTMVYRMVSHHTNKIVFCFFQLVDDKVEHHSCSTSPRMFSARKHRLDNEITINMCSSYSFLSLRHKKTVFFESLKSDVRLNGCFTHPPLGIYVFFPARLPDFVTSQSLSGDEVVGFLWVFWGYWAIQTYPDPSGKQT